MADIDWQTVARLVLTSRLIDHIEETELYPAKRIAYQFSAKGHELSQAVLGLQLHHPLDAVTGYYRSRPMLLTLGCSIADIFAGPLGKAGGFSDGRDIGVVFNFQAPGKARMLPVAGDVGSQYTPGVGWAEALRYRFEVLKELEANSAIAVILGGEGSVATNGFWSALTVSTTEQLPVVFWIEDNGFAISVPAAKQTPGGNIAANLASFSGLRIFEGDGTSPKEVANIAAEATHYVRAERKPAFVRLEVPRLSGHSGQDSQAYKSKSQIDSDVRRDPLAKLKKHLLAGLMTVDEWGQLEMSVEETVRAALVDALARPEPDPATITSSVFAPLREAVEQPISLSTAARINMQEAIRRTLEVELARDSRLLLFGEDVAAKGGVHAVTLGLSDRFGPRRVFDTSLSEEGIIGRAVGLALAGLKPLPEIQFRKYADAATEQLHNCGTVRWRTAGAYSAPMVVRLAGGFSRRAGDPWHSITDEMAFARAVGWQVVIPSNASDAVGLLRSAICSDNPTIFFEHRALLDAPSARRPYPGDDYCIPIGVASVIQEGRELTLVSWGGMIERCEEAILSGSHSVELIDLRSIQPWDEATVLRSVQKTKRCLIVHEDGRTGGFGAEIAATLVEKCFFDLDAPIVRLATPDVPTPYNPLLMEAVLPTAAKIAAQIEQLLQI